MEFVNVEKEQKKETLLKLESKFRTLELMCSTIVAVAKANTSNKKEYDAYLKGCAHFFHKYCTINATTQSSYYKIDSIDDAILYIEKILKRLKLESEQDDHKKILEWLKELKDYKKK